MIKKIVKGKQIFARMAEPATEDDRQIVTDLLDTLRANSETCVGMAANMIGVNKAIIAVAAGPFYFAMVNPVITKKIGEYQTKESCLSLDGVRDCTRYEEIEVDYLDSNFKAQHGKYSGFTAQIIQHEIDHCNGVDKIMTAWAEQNWKKPEFDFSERNDRVTLKLEVGQVVYIPGAADIRNKTDNSEIEPAEDMSKEDKILAYIKKNGGISTQKVMEICNYNSRTGARNLLDKMIKEELIEKIGESRKTFYRIKE